MPTPSPKMGLALPSQTDDFETSDVRENWEKIDAAPGIFICTSGTRPTGWTSQQEGRHIYEKDTRVKRFWTGTEWEADGPEPGDLKTSHRATPSTGWLLCDGRAVPRTAYPGLFAAIGTTSGVGDNATTFNLPDYRNRVIRGSGPGTSRGQLVGSDSVTLGAANLPSHQHSMDHGHTGGTNSVNTDHVHSGSTDTHGGHQHYYQLTTGGSGVVSNTSAKGSGGNAGSGLTDSGGSHAHGFSTGYQNVNGAHSHTVTINNFSGSTGLSGTGTAFTITPQSTVANVFVRA